MVTRTSPRQLAFSSGEIDPLLHRRVDYQRFQSGLALCNGFLPLPQGGFTRAPGTYYRGRTRNDGLAVLVPFQFAANDSLCLEFTANRMRVWRYGERVTSVGAFYELVTPYDEAALPSLRWVQSADVVYLVDGLRPIHKLSRFALDNWTIEPLELDSGPFRIPNLRKQRKVTASAETGSITLTATHDTFEASDVGSLFQLEPEDRTSVLLWTSNEDLTVGARRRYGDKVYELAAGTNAGENPPVHSDGVAATDNSTRWRYISDATGIVRITAVASATSASADVLRTIPGDCAGAGNPTYRWSRGAWSARHGYPSCLEIFDQRLVAAATARDPRTVWFSAAGGLEDFTEGTDADEAFAYTVAGSGSVNRVLALRRGRNGLHIFGLGEEHASRSESRQQVIGPTTAVFDLIGSSGCNGAPPISADGDPIFIPRGEDRIMIQSYSLQSDSTRAANLSRASQHIGARRFKEMVWQNRPEPTAWLRLGDGTLAAMVYEPSEEVLGWSRHSLAGGVVESMAVVPDASGTADVLTMIVRRVIGGQTRRFVEEQALPFGTSTDASFADACHLFAAIRRTESSAFTTVLTTHLAGQTVHVWTDRGPIGPLTVQGGGILVLPYGVTSAIVGLLDETHEARTLDIQAASPNGDTTGRWKRMKKIGIGYHRTGQAQIGIVETSAHVERQTDHGPLIPPQVAPDMVQAYSGIARVDMQSGLAREVAISVRPVGGAPVTITSIVPTIEEAGE